MSNTSKSYTSYKVMFQLHQGGPLVHFDGMWLFADTTEMVAGMFEEAGFNPWTVADVHFIEVHGVRKDGGVDVLMGDIAKPTPTASCVIRIKGIVTQGSEAYKEVQEHLRRHAPRKSNVVSLADHKSKVVTTPLTLEPTTPPATPPNRDDFPAVITMPK